MIPDLPDLPEPAHPELLPSDLAVKPDHRAFSWTSSTTTAAPASSNAGAAVVVDPVAPEADQSLTSSSSASTGSFPATWEVPDGALDAMWMPEASSPERTDGAQEEEGDVALDIDTLCDWVLGLGDDFPPSDEEAAAPDDSLSLWMEMLPMESDEEE